jgi:DHA2 family multidrug resistance protein
VLDTGLLLVPRGIGIIFSMAIAGRLVARGTDPRWLVGIGLAIAAISLWEMTGWTLVMGARHFILTGLIQGAGLGLIFIPLNITAFATLGPHQRTEGSSLMNLSRNIGASVGISIVVAMLARNTQASHMELAAHVTAGGLTGKDPIVASAMGSNTDMALSVIDGLVNQQAAMIAYLDDFKLMMILTACAIPLVLLMRRPRGTAATKADADAMGH